MRETFLKIMKKAGISPAEKHLLIGLSGGIDSVVLAHLTYSCGFEFAVAHCNFLLRGKESNEDEKFVETVAKDWQISGHIKRFDTKKIARTKKISVQMAARELRYNWFEELRNQFHYDYLLTAHHKNDNLETILLNLTRGTGIDGISGIPQKTKAIFRPLLEFTRLEIETYAKTNNLKFREDSSNTEEKYARNLLRKKVIPVLRQLNPSIENTMHENIRNFQQVASLKKEWIEKKIKLLGINFFEGENRIAIEKLKAESHIELLLHEIFSRFEFNSAQINSIRNLLQAETGKKVFNAHFTVIRNRNFLVVKRNSGIKFQPIFINDFPFHSSLLSCKIFPEKNFTAEKTDHTFYFDYDLLPGKLIVRNWKNGDRFYPSGMKGSKKLSDFFVGLKLNAFQKEKVLVLESGGEIVWIIGLRSDRRFRISEKTKRVLCVSYNGDNIYK